MSYKTVLKRSQIFVNRHLCTCALSIYKVLCPSRMFCDVIVVFPTERVYHCYTDRSIVDRSLENFPLAVNMLLTHSGFFLRRTHQRRPRHIHIEKKRAKNKRQNRTEKKEKEIDD